MKDYFDIEKFRLPDDYVKSLERIKFYSSLEDMVVKDMHKCGLNYPHCSVEAVEKYWKERLE